MESLQWRRRPEIADFCPLSWSNASWHLEVSLGPWNLGGGGLFPPFNLWHLDSGPEKGVITKGVCSLEKSLEPLKSLNSLESLENGRNLLYFSQSGDSLETLESLNSRVSRKWTFLKRPLFQKTPLFRTRLINCGLGCPLPAVPFWTSPISIKRLVVLEAQ